MNKAADKLSHDKKQNILIKECVKFLKSKDLDGETTQAILEGIGMDEQIFNQLKNTYITD